MFKLNQKGFTLIEIIGAVTILTVLTVITVGAITQYLDWSRKKSFDTMAKSASDAAEQYVMDYPHASVTEEVALSPEGYDTGITFDQLNDLGYLTTIKDPMGGGNCTGNVIIGILPGEESNKRALDKYMYVVHECCPNYRARYIFTYKTVTYEEKVHGEVVVKERLQPISKVSKSDAICD